jgi:hypothetical protein
MQLIVELVQHNVGGSAVARNQASLLDHERVERRARPG